MISKECLQMGDCDLSDLMFELYNDFLKSVIVVFGTEFVDMTIINKREISKNAIIILNELSPMEQVALSYIVDALKNVVNFKDVSSDFEKKIFATDSIVYSIFYPTDLSDFANLKRQLKDNYPSIARIFEIFKSYNERYRKISAIQKQGILNSKGTIREVLGEYKAIEESGFFEDFDFISSSSISSMLKSKFKKDYVDAKDEYQINAFSPLFITDNSVLTNLNYLTEGDNFQKSISNVSKLIILSKTYDFKEDYIKDSLAIENYTLIRRFLQSCNNPNSPFSNNYDMFIKNMRKDFIADKLKSQKTFYGFLWNYFVTVNSNSVKEQEDNDNLIDVMLSAELAKVVQDNMEFLGEQIDEIFQDDSVPFVLMLIEAELFLTETISKYIKFKPRETTSKFYEFLSENIKKILAVKLSNLMKKKEDDEK